MALRADALRDYAETLTYADGPTKKTQGNSIYFHIDQQSRPRKG
jgi:L,D-peptidoglycan transpeptidase YkuD (ErfK/YbiS/YcfS/YnhG family)